ncbi:hypothetical protein AC477_03295 [miscellaneous Crenarchaeota group-1 archaeon SG8-32-1]|uniref:Uncharacterized protein n=1 Tax=miscellaneous Crenarchaeota group-1 archaeon SG8-32-1 TaxID=1685124 RepID=A0A0M0BU90_9ARCH|nr:MAG: hypothetical protein AC477_03295 [miscellaneous Crenarchaeota group-1 archaeon SG8-32-1]
MKKPSLVVLLLILSLFLVSFPQIEEAKAQGTIYIRADGTVEGTDKIHQSGDIYRLTANISEGIQIQKSSIVLDGEGFTLQGNGEGRGIDLSNGRGQDPSRPEINNVTVKNLKILNFYYGIDNANTNNNTFYGNYIENCQSSLWIIGSLNNNITFNTLNNASISINYSGSNIITKNNFINCWVTLWLSTPPIMDGNYWNNYNGTDNNGDGMGDTPYVIDENNQDNYPLMEPVVIPEFPSWLILPLFLVLAPIVVVIRNKISHKSWI